MPAQEQTPLTPETVRRVAREVAGVPLSESDLVALLPILTMLFSDAAAAQSFDRRGVEPEIRFVLEEWRP